MRVELSVFALPLILIAVYLAVAETLGPIYPLSPMTMFSGGQSVASRIVVRTGDGRLFDVERFNDWDCGGEVTFPEKLTNCAVEDYSPLDTMAAETIRRRTRSSPDTELVRLERRIFSVEERDQAMSVHDCLIRTCRARLVL